MSPPIRPARPVDLELLPGIEEASNAIFAEHGIGPLPRVATTAADLGRAAYVLVAGDPVIGFARLEMVDGQAHLEQLSVHPDAARRGAGSGLIEACAAWAARSGYETLTLCTFAAVPWNAPMYLRHGFEVVATPGPGLTAMRDAERRRGLDDVGERVVLRRAVGPWAVLDDLTTGLSQALGPELLGLYAHGSLVGGDFAPARSDLDVLAVVVRPPDATMLTAVAPVHARLERRHPGWHGRVEVETVALSTVEAFVDGGAGVDDSIMRISPGEALHLLPATAHRVLTWASVREKGRTLAGRPAREMLPLVGPDVARDAVLDACAGLARMGRGDAPRRRAVLLGAVTVPRVVRRPRRRAAVEARGSRPRCG